MLTTKQTITALVIGLINQSALANYEFKLTDDDKLSFGGYVKFDARTVSGDVAFRDYWIGTGTALTESKTTTKFLANESRFNMKYQHGEVTGFIELDFYGSGGNEVISNSVAPRIRHSFIQYKGLLVGQTWTTFMNTSALPEAADFGGPHTAIVFVRQGQVRYTMGNFAIALENPESYGGDASEDSLPDLIAKYTFKGDWGNVSVAGLARQLNTLDGNSESAFGVSVAGKVKVGERDDIRFQVHTGDLGRYVGTAAAKDIENNKVESTDSYMVSYRHYWQDDYRTTVFYGNTKTDEANADRTHWGINLFNNLTKSLAVGVEVGNFEMADKNVDSTYVQFSAKYTL
jgi:hypothetical protein